MFLANLASVYMKQERLTEAEPLLRQALEVYARTLPPEHINVGISRVKLGRTLKLQGRHADAVVESRAGFDLLAKQQTQPVVWLVAGAKDLIEIYDALDRKADADRYRARLADMESTASASKPK